MAQIAVTDGVGFHSDVLLQTIGVMAIDAVIGGQKL